MIDPSIKLLSRAGIITVLANEGVQSHLISEVKSLDELELDLHYAIEDELVDLIEVLIELTGE